MKTRKIIGTIVATLIAITLIGCGGGNQSSSNAPLHNDEIPEVSIPDSSNGLFSAKFNGVYMGNIATQIEGDGAESWTAIINSESESYVIISPLNPTIWVDRLNVDVIEETETEIQFMCYSHRTGYTGTLIVQIGNQIWATFSADFIDYLHLPESYEPHPNSTGIELVDVDFSGTYSGTLSNSSGELIGDWSFVIYSNGIIDGMIYVFGEESLYFSGACHFEITQTIGNVYFGMIQGDIDNVEHVLLGTISSNGSVFLGFKKQFESTYEISGSGTKE